jgi:hypothetical protein
MSVPKPSGPLNGTVVQLKRVILRKNESYIHPPWPAIPKCFLSAIHPGPPYPVEVGNPAMWPLCRWNTSSNEEYAVLRQLDELHCCDQTHSAKRHYAQRLEPLGLEKASYRYLIFTQQQAQVIRQELGQRLKQASAK